MKIVDTNNTVEIITVGANLADLEYNPEIKKAWYEDIAFEEAKAFIRANIISVSRSSVAIGYYLKYVRDRELFIQDGYSSVWDFADAEYGISKSTASRFMSINDRFSQGGNTPHVDQEFKDFSRSQLQEMLYLTDEQLEQVTPQTQIKQIREIRSTEIPYIEIPGQLSINDFPEVMPDYVPIQESPDIRQEAIAHTGSTTFTFSDFAGGAEQTIAISQQLEEDTQPEDYTQPGDYHGTEEAPMVTKKISEETEKSPELPYLKNNDQRREWLRNHRDWGLWYEDEHIGVKYYKYDFSDGTRLIAEEYISEYTGYDSYLHLVGGPPEREINNMGCNKYPYHKYYSKYPDSESELTEFLKAIQKRQE